MPKVDKLALDVHRELAVVHVLEYREGDRQSPKTMYTLDQHPIEIQNQKLLFNCRCRSG